MRILILGAGKMGSFFCDLLSFEHDVAVYDHDPQKLRVSYNCRRFATLDEIDDFNPELVINAATVRYTLEAF
ncbi:MAG: prephenate dehydrogenase/arogenate dehydrogenase family protein, partial [Candidatus Amulumruptor sp.]|nr:prephenate dehydrogenase/arogenate dehydrogenase family protein [Candidatus Amulumruptor sp.]